MAEAEPVVVGRVGAPHGVRGWVRVNCFGAPSEALLQSKHWLLGERGNWTPMEVAESSAHGKNIIARLSEVSDRDQATRLRHKQVAVARVALPATVSGEYYWYDLQGLDVVNLQGAPLGEVVDLIDTGANSVLVVRGEEEVLIPFTDDVIAKVELGARVLTVDWQADY